MKKTFTLNQAKSIYFDQIGGIEYTEEQFENLFENKTAVQCTDIAIISLYLKNYENVRSN